jgi:hypothetical protein
LSNSFCKKKVQKVKKIGGAQRPDLASHPVVRSQVWKRKEKNVEGLVERRGVKRDRKEVLCTAGREKSYKLIREKSHCTFLPLDSRKQESAQIPD